MLGCVTMSDVTLSDVKLSDVTISDVTLSDVTLSNVTLSDVTLSDVTLSATLGQVGPCYVTLDDKGMKRFPQSNGHTSLGRGALNQ